MLRSNTSWPTAVLAALAIGLAAPIGAAEIGQIKVAKGQVSIERQGQALPADAGMRLQTADVVKTGADGSVGITMSDNSLLSAGPNSRLSLDRYEFDPTTSRGQVDASLHRGTLSMVSGRIAKQQPGAATVRTPAALLERARHRARRQRG